MRDVEILNFLEYLKMKSLGFLLDIHLTAIPEKEVVWREFPRNRISSQLNPDHQLGFARDTIVELKETFRSCGRYGVVMFPYSTEDD
jgi:hypothetical protein